MVGGESGSPTFGRFTVKRTILLGLTLLLTQAGCVSTTIDEMVMEPSAEMGDSSVVVLGRRHSSDYETEPDFIQCVGKKIAAGKNGVRVITENEFVDGLYPWFEPRTAPMQVENLEELLKRPKVLKAISDMGTSYIIWIDGSTETTVSIGSVTCAISTAGGGCFGFGSWKDDAKYEASIWNYTDLNHVGRMSAEATGQSYMPAFVIPIPIIAPVQSSACDSLGQQLLQYLNPTGAS
jgi:hypothetical protein